MLVRRSGKLVEINGTDKSDVISLMCKSLSCIVQVNGEEVELKSSTLVSSGLKISGMGGDDVITVHFDQDIYIFGVKVVTGEGNNIIDLDFQSTSEGVVYLGNGKNTILIPETGANVLVHGIAYNGANKIKMHSCEKDAPKPQLERYNDSGVYSLILNDYELLQLDNDISDSEFPGHSYQEAEVLAGELPNRLNNEYFEYICK